MRHLLHANKSWGNLRHNHQHMFAANHALSLYKANGIYSFIPKNACSTMRLSLALYNGTIDSVNEHMWIHQNNNTFVADLRDLMRADYTFVILRCPFSRLLSAYLDKIVGLTPEAWMFYELTGREIHPTRVTFEYFVHKMGMPRICNGNIHWRPQHHFLVYKKYDNYFCLENFQEARSTLKTKIDLDIQDARRLTHHGVQDLRTEEIDQNSSELTALELLNMKDHGCIPPLVSFYTENLANTVKSVYKEDIEIYQSLFTSDNLMFNI